MTIITARTTHIDEVRAAGYTMERAHVASWLYDHLAGKTWKNMWEESGPGFDQYRIGPMGLSMMYDHISPGEAPDWSFFQTEWFPNDGQYQAETALYAAIVLWLSEHRPACDAVADARDNLVQRHEEYERLFPIPADTGDLREWSKRVNTWYEARRDTYRLSLGDTPSH